MVPVTSYQSNVSGTSYHQQPDSNGSFVHRQDSNSAPWFSSRSGSGALDHHQPDSDDSFVPVEDIQGSYSAPWFVRPGTNSEAYDRGLDRYQSSMGQRSGIGHARDSNSVPRAAASISRAPENELLSHSGGSISHASGNHRSSPPRAGFGEGSIGYTPGNHAVQHLSRSGGSIGRVPENHPDHRQLPRAGVGEGSISHAPENHHLSLQFPHAGVGVGSSIGYTPENHAVQHLSRSGGSIGHAPENHPNQHLSPRFPHAGVGEGSTGHAPENHRPSPQFPRVGVGNGRTPHDDYRAPPYTGATSYPAQPIPFSRPRRRAASDSCWQNPPSLGSYRLNGSEPPHSLAPHKFQDVELLPETLGTGSYGTVHKAKCEGTLTCAAKVIHDALLTARPDPRSPEGRFRQECEMLSSLRHPNVVQYLGTHSHERKLLLLMELMDESLTKFLERSRMPLPFHTQVNICHDISLALSFLHSNDIIHRDLSSNNVLMIGDRRAKVTDFGMAKWQVRATSLGGACNTICPGTAHYMPPEALDDNVAEYGKSIDCFSLGVLAIQVLTRSFPNPTERYLVEEVSEVDRRRNDIEAINPEHPILHIAQECLQNNPVRRPVAGKLSVDFEDLKEVEDYLRSVRNSCSSSSPPASAPSHLERKLPLVEAQSVPSYHERELSVQREELERIRRERTLEEARNRDRLEAKDKEIARLQSQLTQQNSGTQIELSRLQQECVRLQREVGDKEELVGIFEKERMTAIVNAEELRHQLSTETRRLKDTQQILAETLQGQTVATPTVQNSHDHMTQHATSSLPSSFAAAIHSGTGQRRALSSLDAFAVGVNKCSTLTLDLPLVVTATLTIKDRSVQANVKSTHEVSFTPEVRGTHRLDVSMNGESLNSYRVVVDQPINEITAAMPVKVVPCPSNLSAFCVSNRLIYYADDQQKYHILDASADVSNLVESVWCKRTIKHIVVDSNGFVYFTSDHQLHKFSPGGQKAAVVGEEYSGFSNTMLYDPEGLGVEPGPEERIHVCDTGNARIMVFNTNLDFIGKYGEGIITKVKVPKSSDKPGHLSSPLDIAFSSSGKAYILDNVKNAVVIFKNMIYNSILSLGGQEIVAPTALCFRHNHLLVADWAGSCLWVYDRVQDRWQNVHKVELQGNPRGACTDPDGFIYVSEKTNAVTLY